MKAAIYHEFGESEVIKYEDADKPAISSEEVLINVKSVSLNQLDVRLRSGKYWGNRYCRSCFGSWE